MGRFATGSGILPLSWLTRGAGRQEGAPARDVAPGWVAGCTPALALILLLAVAAALRLYGLDWDGGHWLHPDERKVYFVVMELGWPRSLTEVLSPDSPLNPGFFAYGSLPFYLLKLASALAALVWPALRNPDHLHLVGRPLAVLFDLATICLTYRLARTLWPSWTASTPGGRVGLGSAGGALLAAALVGVAVLHVQLAHFYTADPLLTTFVLLTLNLAADVAHGGGWWRRVGLGIALGLALATKVIAFPLLLVVPVAYNARFNADLSRPASPDLSPRPRVPRLLALAAPTLGTLIVAGAIFVLTQPYALIDWRTFLEHTIQESEIARGSQGVPYTIQYAGTLPFVYSIWQTALWGLGLPLGLAAWAGLVHSFLRWLRQGIWADGLLLAWAGPYFVLTGLLYTRYLRYMLPLTPILCILAVRLLSEVGRRHDVGDHQLAARPSRFFVAGALVLGIATAAYALLFVRIYAGPHSWIAASEWIFGEIPAGSTLAVEHWDTALPLPVVVDDNPRPVGQYSFRTLYLYREPDDAAKWGQLAADLAESDYLIVASRRLYGSIPRVPERYPVASHYHEQLFAGELGFELAGEFTRGPVWLNPRLPPLSDPAPGWLQPDESFVVYDRPRALVFRNTAHLSPDELLQRLGLDD